MEMDGIEFEIFKHGELVNKVTIQQIRPCIVAENMVRVLLQLDSEIKDIIPLLATKYPPGNVNYIENKRILTLNISDRLVTLYPSGKVSMNKTVNENDAIDVITEVMRNINQAYNESKNAETVDYSEMNKRLANVGPLALYNCLPKTDCEKCGEATCMAFSIKLLSGDSKLNKCKPLVENGDITCLEELLGSQLMQTMGW